MISSQAAHPNCMYQWMNFIVSPKANAEVAQYFGEAPAQSKACDPSTLTQAAKAYGFREPEVLRPVPRRRSAFWKRVTTGRRRWPIAATAVAICKDYNDWVTAWTDIKG